METLTKEQEILTEKPKKPKKKIWISVLTVVLVLAIVLVFALGNFIFKTTVLRADGFDSLPPISKLSLEDQKILDENVEALKKETEAWLFSSEIEEVEITSFDGLSLNADVITPKENKTNLWVVPIHGYHCDREEGKSFGSQYGLKGYNVLAPDLRAHGKSQGNVVGMGWLDRKDILSWIDYIISIDSEAKIVLHGLSMGASTVMMTIGEEALPKNVVGAVEDCGYTSAWDIFAKELKTSYHVPAVPFLSVASSLFSQKGGYNFKEASAVEQIKKTEIPVLFIHGEEDDFVPCEMVHKVFDACNSQKQLLIVPKAGHAQSFKLEKDKYFETVFSFLEENCIDKV